MPRLALLLATLALAGCGGGDSATQEEPSPQGSPAASLTELTNLLALRSDFEAAAGKTRLLLLFSPT